MKIKPKREPKQEPALEPKPPTEQERVQAFQAEYIKLCEKHGLTHVYRPDWRMSMDTGTYSLVVQVTVTAYQPQPA